MILFDDIERTDKQFIPGETQFNLLNRSARLEDVTIRHLLELWLTRYPCEAQKHLLARLRGDDHSYNGAAFELILHEILVNLGCTVKINDMYESTRRPDFLIQHENRRCYVEATIVDPKLSPFAPNSNQDDAISKLNTLKSKDFRILVTTQGRLSTTLSRRKITQPFEKLISEYDPIEVQKIINQHGDEARPSAEIKCGDWKLQGTLVPRSINETPYASNQDIVMGTVLGPDFVSSSSSVKRALSNKATRSRYGTLDAPFIIAVNARDPFFTDTEILNVVLGDLHVTLFDDDSIPTGSSRKNNGIWPRYSSLGAVIVFHHLDPRNLHASICLYLNPYIDNICLPKPMYRLRHMKGETLLFEGENGCKNVAGLLGI